MSAALCLINYIVKAVISFHLVYPIVELLWAYVMTKIGFKCILHRYDRVKWVVYKFIWLCIIYICERGNFAKSEFENSCIVLNRNNRKGSKLE